MNAFVAWLLTQIPANMAGAVAVIALFLFAVKAQWIPLSVNWKNKKVIATEEEFKKQHYVTRDYLMKNCDTRQSKLDGTLNRQLDYINEQFKSIFSMLQTMNHEIDTALKLMNQKIDTAIVELTKQVSEHDGSIRVLQERTSHHRKDDSWTEQK